MIVQLLENPEEFVKTMSVTDLLRLEEELEKNGSRLSSIFPLWKLRRAKILIKQSRKKKFQVF